MRLYLKENHTAELSNGHCVSSVQRGDDELMTEQNEDTRLDTEGTKNDESVVAHSDQTVTKRDFEDTAALKTKKIAPPRLPPRIDSLNSLAAKRPLPPVPSQVRPTSTLTYKYP